ncbi:MAG: NepR family anti-sigma factor [Candidatus Kaistia colombiensis]|nr:MAG: NepR family anti-sigma factor [Kaistia sp.]
MENNDSNAKSAEFRSASPVPNSQEEKEDWIGRQLRRVFDNALNEPLPDDIMSLLNRIDDETPAADQKIPKGGA